MSARPVSDVYDIIERLAQLWIVAKCKCCLKKTKSLSHVDCFAMEPWVEEEFRNCIQISKEIEDTANQNEREYGGDCTMFAESMDSLQ